MNKQELFKQTGATKRYIGDLMGVSDETINNWLRPERKAPPEFIQAMEDLFWARETVKEKWINGNGKKK